MHDEDDFTPRLRLPRWLAKLLCIEGILVAAILSALQASHYFKIGMPIAGIFVAIATVCAVVIGFFGLDEDIGVGAVAAVVAGIFTLAHAAAWAIYHAYHGTLLGLFALAGGMFIVQCAVGVWQMFSEYRKDKMLYVKHRLEGRR